MVFSNALNLSATHLFILLPYRTIHLPYLSAVFNFICEVLNTEDTTPFSLLQIIVGLSVKHNYLWVILDKLFNPLLSCPLGKRLLEREHL